MTDLDNTVREFQTGNRSAFATLVNRYQNFVVSVAYSLIGDIGRSEDVAQQAFVLAWQKQDELKDASRFGGWIRSIARNIARNEKRKIQRHATVDFEPGQEVAITVDEPTPLDVTIANEQSEWLWHVLQQIPEIYREPIVMFYRHGKSVSEVALMLEVSEDAVKQRLLRGRKAMREEIATAVEKSLEQQRPNPSFTFGVFSAIASTAAAKATGAAVTSGVSAASSGLSISAVIGSVGGFLGAGIGVGGAVYGSRKSLGNATSIQEKKYIWKMIGWSMLLVSAIMSWQMIGGFLFPAIARHPLGIGIAWSVYSIALVWMIAWGNRRIREIKKKYGNEQERNENSIANDQPISLLGMCSNIVGSSLGCWLWFILLVGISRAWLLMGISITLFVTSAAVGCTLARTRKTIVSQLQLNGQFVLLTTFLVAINVIAAWPAVKANVTVYSDGIDVSGWLLAIFIFAIGIAISQTMFWRAKKLLDAQRT